MTSNVIPAAPITPSAAPAAAGTDPGAFELAFWNSVKDAKSAAEIKTYLDRYPRGTFAGIAKVKYDELRAEAATPSSPGARLSPAGAVASAAAPQPASAVTIQSHPPSGFAGELTDFGVQPQSTLQFNLGSATPTSIRGGLPASASHAHEQQSATASRVLLRLRGVLGILQRRPQGPAARLSRGLLVSRGQRWNDSNKRNAAAPAAKNPTALTTVRYCFEPTKATRDPLREVVPICTALKASDWITFGKNR